MISVNAYTGEAALAYAGAAIRLRFDWAALAEIKAALGGDFRTRVPDALESLDLDAIAAIVAAASGGALKAADVVRMSPPLVPLTMAIHAGLTAALHGPEDARKVAEAAKPAGPFVRALQSLRMMFAQSWRAFAAMWRRAASRARSGL